VRGLGRNYWKLWTASVISNLGDGVSTVAYPWLASAVTRDPLLLASVAVAQRIPWLIFALPAGVITDRVDRRKLIAGMDLVRFALTFGVAVAVLAGSGSFPSADEIAGGEFVTAPGIYLILLLVSALLFGFAEVLRDNAAQTILPAIVVPDKLETANGSLYGAEMVMNSFVGPPVGGLIIGAAFALPFFVDAGTFAVAAALIFLLSGEFRARPGTEPPARIEWRKEIGAGVRWLWGHELLRPMAVILGVMNGVFSMALATYVFFVQEVLLLDAARFGVLLTAGAVGGIIGSVTAARIAKTIGSGTSLLVTLGTSTLTLLLTGVTSDWIVVWVMFALGSLVASLWNVITVSLRQTIIPDELLGRVNSVYRFFAWGMIPIGLLAGGAIVAGVEAVASRDLALRMPFLVAAGVYLVLFVYSIPRLTTERIEAARAEATVDTGPETGPDPTP
jgi:MFS family permease